MRRRHLRLRRLERQRRLASSFLQMLDVVVDPPASLLTSTCPRRTNVRAAGPVDPSSTANLSAQSRIRSSRAAVEEERAAALNVGTSGAAGGLPSSTMLSSEGLASSSQPSSSSTTAAPTLAAAATETPLSLRPSKAQKEREVQELLKEAQTMLHKLTQLSSMRVSTDESVAQLDLLMKAAGLNSEGAALLDSGASHPFRMPNQGEVQNAQTVKVQLADGKEVLLRQNRAGTLMPVRVWLRSCPWETWFRLWLDSTCRAGGPASSPRPHEHAGFRQVPHHW